MDELDLLSIEVAQAVIQRETEQPGSQASISIDVAKQILAQLLSDEARSPHDSALIELTKHRDSHDKQSR